MVPNYSFHRKDAQVRDSYFGWPGVSNKQQEGESYRSLCTSLEAIFCKTMKGCTSLSMRLEWSPLLCPQASHLAPLAMSCFPNFKMPQHSVWTALPWPRVLGTEVLVRVCARKKTVPYLKVRPEGQNHTPFSAPLLKILLTPGWDPKFRATWTYLKDIFEKSLGKYTDMLISVLTEQKGSAFPHESL